ncbi:uncharacterized protein LOC117647739 [Thrips palmi]|uniref:Uncharacterized protein LOC117647739 n=1 Tax=Thrips palmi TaxID=161013 RepID=A0A6P8YZC6_THRPL|nr:uncharacterized protein LOC117647739 [Thrips palmi]
MCDAEEVAESVQVAWLCCFGFGHLSRPFFGGLRVEDCGGGKEVIFVITTSLSGSGLGVLRTKTKLDSSSEEDAIFESDMATFVVEEDTRQEEKGEEDKKRRK